MKLHIYSHCSAFKSLREGEGFDYLHFAGNLSKQCLQDTTPLKANSSKQRTLYLHFCSKINSCLGKMTERAGGGGGVRNTRILG